MTLGDRQAAAGRQGHAFEETVEVLLRVEGWTILERNWRHPVIDIEVDIVAIDPSGTEWWVECKGSWESSRNGLQRTDTFKKAIANAALLRVQEDRRPYMIIASHLPVADSAGDRWVPDSLQNYVDEIRVVGFTRRSKDEVLQDLTGGEN